MSAEDAEGLKGEDRRTGCATGHYYDFLAFIVDFLDCFEDVWWNWICVRLIGCCVFIHRNR